MKRTGRDERHGLRGADAVVVDMGFVWGGVDMGREEVGVSHVMLSQC